MLSLIVVASALLLQNVNGDARYANADINFAGMSSRSWTFPLDICVQTAAMVTTEMYGLFECNDAGDTLYWNVYADAACATNSTGVTQYTMTDKVASDTYAFNCDGTDDYIVIEAFLNSDTCADPPLATMYGAINTCVFSEVVDSVSTYNSASCDGNGGTIEAFEDSATCAVAANADPTTIEPECGLFYAMSDAFLIYGQMTGCYDDGVAQDEFTTPSPTDAAGIHSPLLVVTTVLVTVFGARFLS